MSGVDENNVANSATGIQNNALPYRPPFAQRQQREMELSPMRIRGSAPEEERVGKRCNPRKRAEGKVFYSNDATYDLRMPTITTGSPDTSDLSFGNTPFRRLCMGLWEQLDNAMRQRERAIEEKEIEVAHNLSILRVQSEAITKERLYLEKLRQEAEFLRRQALEQTKKLEEQIAELKNMQHLPGHESVREVVDKEESKQVDNCDTLSRRQIPESVDSQLDELLAREPITNHVTISPSAKICNLTSNNQGVAADAEKEPQFSTDSKIILYTPPCPQNSVGPLAKVKAEPTDEYSRPYQQCLVEDGKLMLTALPEITVFLDIGPRMNGNELRIVKTEGEEEMSEDLEDVPLTKRRKLLQSKTSRNKKKAEGEHLNSSRKTGAGSNKEATKKQFATFLPSAAADCFRAEVKKRTVSMEIALQEDAPGLLEALCENGLYEDLQTIGIVWENDSEELNHQTENFEELEGVINKLWGSCSGLFKEGRNRLHNTQGGNKPSYCLPCLISLIEQTKAFRHRKWPVEWGWCRQLCAFLFVFEKHNRIVLERPEYGFATYFFELVQELPVKWQVQRLIKVMSVTNNCRAALVENRALQVGVDLVEEEAAILEDYGWIPNSGIGSLLNFCERVSHDYKSDELVDWRSKIGKLLMDGHDHGRIMPRIPHKFQEKDLSFMENANPSCEDKAIVAAETTRVNGQIDAIIKAEL